MKKNKTKLIFILLIFASVGIIIAGGFLGSSIMVIGGIVSVFGGSFLISIILFVKIVLEVKNERNSEELDKKSKEEDFKTQINSTYGYDNQIAQGKRMMHAVADNWKVSSSADKIKGFLFVFIFIACCLMFVIFSSVGKIVWALASWGAGFALILFALIIKKIIEFKSIKNAKKFKDNKIIGSEYNEYIAVVKDCVFSSESYSGWGNKMHSTSRIVSTTYKVILKINNTTKVAYSKEFYNPGTKVKIIAKTTSKNAYILRQVTEYEN